MVMMMMIGGTHCATVRVYLAVDGILIYQRTLQQRMVYQYNRIEESPRRWMRKCELLTCVRFSKLAVEVCVYVCSSCQRVSVCNVPIWPYTYHRGNRSTVSLYRQNVWKTQSMPTSESFTRLARTKFVDEIEKFRFSLHLSLCWQKYIYDTGRWWNNQFQGNHTAVCFCSKGILPSIYHVSLYAVGVVDGGNARQWIDRPRNNLSWRENSHVCYDHVGGSASARSFRNQMFAQNLYENTDSLLFSH